MTTQTRTTPCQLPLTDDARAEALRWRDALVDGSHTQGRGWLRRSDGSMCCLGVRCDVDDPDAWRWIEMSDRWQWHGQSGSAPTEVMIHFELDEVGIRGDGHTWIIGGEEFVQLATANDQAHITHAMIADALTDYFGLPPYVPVDPS